MYPLPYPSCFMREVGALTRCMGTAALRERDERGKAGKDGRGRRETQKKKKETVCVCVREREQAKK